jgi:uncharacterized protein DUF4314
MTRLEAKRLEPAQRVRFLGFGTPDPTPLPHGTEGTVQLVDDLGTVHVRWDNGISIGLILDPPRGQPADRIARVE